MRSDNRRFFGLGPADKMDGYMADGRFTPLLTPRLPDAPMRELAKLKGDQSCRGRGQAMHACDVRRSVTDQRRRWRRSLMQALYPTSPDKPKDASGRNVVGVFLM